MAAGAWHAATRTWARAAMVVVVPVEENLPGGDEGRGQGREGIAPRQRSGERGFPNENLNVVTNGRRDDATWRTFQIPISKVRSGRYGFFICLKPNPFLTETKLESSVEFDWAGVCIMKSILYSLPLLAVYDPQFPLPSPRENGCLACE